MIVVDTCVITHLFNETELTPLAQEILSINPHWCVPTLWREEYANVLAKLFRKSKSTQAEVLGLFDATCKELKDGEYQIEVRDALHCAMLNHISVYDAHFVVLAEKFGTYLITEDEEVLKKCKKQALSMKNFIKRH